MVRVLVKRKRYSIADKRKALALLDGGNSIQVTMKAINATRTTIQGWKKDRIKIMEFRGVAKKKQMGLSGRPELIPFSADLKAFMTDMRENEKALSMCHMIDYIKINQRPWFDAYLADKKSMSSGYRATLRLLQRFAHRHGFSQQRASYLKLSTEQLSHLREEFGTFFHNEYIQFDLDAIYNVDETAMYYDMAPKSIWAKRGGSAKISAGDKHSYRMTAVLTVRADEVKLPILFIIRGAEDGTIEASEFEEYPQDHFYAMQSKAWMDERVWREYLYSVLAPSIDKPSVLLVDNFDSHVSDESYRIVQEEFGTVLQPLPPNATSHCQPLDVSLMGPFKQQLRNLYLMEDWVAMSARDKRWAMVHRAIEAWDAITPELVCASFVKAIPRP